MKKLIVGLFVLGLAYQIQAASFTLTCAAFEMKQGLAVNGACKVTQVIATPGTGATNCSFAFVDTYTNFLWYTNTPYTNIISFVTNYSVWYTNYFGATNTSMTTNVLVDVTNAVTGYYSNLYPVRIQGSVPTNATSLAFNGSYWFMNGVWVTNLTATPITLTITYTQ
jgi:hypothetical protein